MPFVAMFGIAGVTMFPTSSGVFMQTVAGGFGWSHSQFAASFLVQVLIGLVAMPVAGRLADKIGARKVVLWGILPFAGSMAMLGLANGTFQLSIIPMVTIGAVLIWLIPSRSMPTAGASALRA